MSDLELGDPLAHRALQALLRAEAAVRRRLALKTLRRRLGWSKANATEVTGTLEARGLVTRSRLAADRRSAIVRLTPAGREIVGRLFPAHSDRVSEAFGALDEGEKRSLAQICRKLAA